MPKVPKKNIEPVLVDVKKPDFNYENSVKFARLDLAKHLLEKESEENMFSFKMPLIVMASLLLIFSGFLFFDLNNTKNLVQERGGNIMANVMTSLGSIKDLDPAEAKVALEQNQESLFAINKDLDSGPSKVFMSVISQISPFFKDARDALKDFTEVNLGLIALSENLNDIQLNGFSYFRNNGDVLVDRLSETNLLVTELQSKIESLRNKSKTLSSNEYLGDLSKVIEENYISYGTDLYVLNDFLAGLVSLIDSEDERRVLLMFQNSSEMRPSGGFLGSYGELIIKDGQMVGLKTEDIYWPDHEINLDEKLIPPKPLQHVTTDWGARDGNWFFDFPTSAETVMSILEMSKIYEEENINFEGAIAINVNVLESLFDITGPIEIEEYDMIINKDNFLSEIQREVEEGEGAVPGKNPKKILSYIAPKIIEEMDKMTKEGSELFLEIVESHFNSKDIMIYSRDPEIARALERFSVDGSIYQIPSGFWGSYLAVVNANIAGGKTDAFIKENINVRVEVSSDGSIISDLSITRDHFGGNEEDHWYNSENKNYLKIFTNPNSNPLFIEGNTERRRVSNNYGSKYQYLENLKKIEDSEIFLTTYNLWVSSEFGKKSYGTWFNIDADSKNTLNFRYFIPPSNDFVLTSGRKFRFVFDKQSGVNNSLSLKIGAPLGYKWEESDSSNFTYETTPDKREVITLTLVSN
ncbi:MAG: DUF4012 domain-containing protein [Candidatus Paceibacterota bacterium]